MSSFPFRKMHGLGNDFVVFDARRGQGSITPAMVPLIADRRSGIGCDQLIVMEPADTGGADLFMRIYNPDGGEAGACGNATRCVAELIMDESGSNHAVIQTRAGDLTATRAADGAVTVDMGEAALSWQDVPLARAMDTIEVPLATTTLGPAICCSMGNPHATFFVSDAWSVDLVSLGPILEHDPIFPERANIGVASLDGPGRLRLRVWERGAGLTLACGSAACAALVAASRKGMVGRQAEIVMTRGSLLIEWRPDGHVLMTGPVALSFTGEFDPAMLSR